MKFKIVGIICIVLGFVVLAYYPHPQDAQWILPALLFVFGAASWGIGKLLLQPATT